MKKAKLLILLTCICTVGHAQISYSQYFDGADTNYYNSVLIKLDTAIGNIWQIGPPQKTIFDSAATLPNALVTDTINTYPVNNRSGFSYTVRANSYSGIKAIQWLQKLDMDAGKDGGMIEMSLDGGTTWESVFDNPYVYNFYGFDTLNVDTLPGGDMAFTGTDTTWRDIWLCYDYSLVYYYDSVMIRHTFISDSVDNQREGWIIDNMLVHPTLIHTVAEAKQADYLVVYPSITTGRLNIEARKTEGFHLIEKLDVFDISGKPVQHYSNVPVKFYIDLANEPAGKYLVRIQTNLKTETFQIVLTH